MPSLASYYLLPLCLSLGVTAAKTTNPIRYNPGFNVSAVLALAISLPSHSWEYGTASEALLELYDPALSIYRSHPFPVPTIATQNSPALTYAQRKL